MSRNLHLDHLILMTDDVGVFQHARYGIPSRNHGYSTDDVARAAIVACSAMGRRSSAQVGERLLATYLAFLEDAQLDDGWFHNFMAYDRRWLDMRGGEDTFGRALWGLGVIAQRAPHGRWRKLALEMLVDALPHVGNLSYLRAHAYTALGLAAALEAHLDRGDLKVALRSVLAPIILGLATHSAPDWHWCEEMMTYDNGRLCEALIAGGAVLAEESTIVAGIGMLEFYAGVVIEDGIFVPIGSDGWYPRGGPRARYAQQPIEAGGFVEACLAASLATGDERWRERARIGAAWYTGGNHAGAQMVEGGACRDGIERDGTSENLGAESVIASLLSAYAMRTLERINLQQAVHA